MVQSASWARSSTDSRLLTRAWIWFAGIGAALIALGAAMSVNLLLATVAAIYYVGAMMLAGGVLQIVHAVAIRRLGKPFFWLLMGAVYLLAGLSVFLDPLFAARLLTLLLAVSLGLSGILRIIIALGGVHGRGWMLVSAVAGIGAAIVIAIGWPFNAVWVLGLVLAIELLVQGLALLLVGLSLRNARGDLL